MVWNINGRGAGPGFGRGRGRAGGRNGATPAHAPPPPPPTRRFHPGRHGQEAEPTKELPPRTAHATHLGPQLRPRPQDRAQLHGRVGGRRPARGRQGSRRRCRSGSGKRLRRRGEACIFPFDCGGSNAPARGGRRQASGARAHAGRDRRVSGGSPGGASGARAGWGVGCFGARNRMEGVSEKRRRALKSRWSRRLVVPPGRAAPPS